MKGILEKKLNGWFVNFTENHPSLMVKQYNKSLPLNPHNIPENGPYVVGVYEEVEFEIEDYWETGLEEVFKVATLITKPLTELKYRDGRPMRSYHSPKIQELLDEINLEEVSKEQLEKERNPAYEYFDIKKNFDKFSLYEHKDTITSTNTPTSSQTENKGLDWLLSHWKKLQSEGEKMNWEQIIQITELAKEVPSSQTEISDEEIQKWAKEYTCKEYDRLIFDYENYDTYNDFVNGAKKYRELLKLK